MQWFLYFLYYVQAAQPVTSTKVQPSWQLIKYWWLTKLQGTYIQVNETCHLRCDNYDNNSYYWHYWWGCDICVCHLLVGSHYSHLAIMTILVNCTKQIMTCEPINIIYFTLGTGNYEFKCYERSYRILGKCLVLYCTVYNRLKVISVFLG